MKKYKTRRTLTGPDMSILSAALATLCTSVAASGNCQSSQEIHQRMHGPTSNWEVRWQSVDEAANSFTRKYGSEVTLEDGRGRRYLTWKEAVEGLHLQALRFNFPVGLVKCSTPLSEATQTEGDLVINIRNLSADVFQSTLTLKGQAVGSAILTFQGDRHSR